MHQLCPGTWTCPAAAGGGAAGKKPRFLPAARWAGQEPGSGASTIAGQEPGSGASTIAGQEPGSSALTSIGAPHDSAVLGAAAPDGNRLGETLWRRQAEETVENDELAPIQAVELTHGIRRVVVAEPPEPV